MEISRRDFLRLAGASAAALGLSGLQLSQAEEALASASSPPVIWLSGASCTGCSVSLLNAINPTIAEVLTQTISLKYHATVMAGAGDLAVTSARSTAQTGGYILVVEGAIPTASGGKYAYVWEENGLPVTMADAVKTLARSAKYVLSVGTCSSFGGIPAVSTVTGAKGVRAYLQSQGIIGGMRGGGPTVINLPGCAPHPDWIVGSIVQILAGSKLTLDAYARPTIYYKSMPIHYRCPRLWRPRATQFGQDGLCLLQLGCKGPSANADCETRLWNNKQSWCVGANGLCIGCVQPSFPSFPLHNTGGQMM